MKRFASVLMAVFLAFSLAVPAFASTDKYPTTKPTGIGNMEYIMYRDNATEQYRMIVYDVDHFSDTANYSWHFEFADKDGVATPAIVYENDTGVHYSLYRCYEGGTSWTLVDTTSKEALHRHTLWMDTKVFEDGNFDIPNSVAGGYYFSVNCDGVGCPATDSDKNNVCDDCEKMLVMSLRTSLLQFARYHVEESIKVYAQMPYWLITEDAAGGYTCIISEQPLTYSNNTLNTSGNMRVGTAKILSNGENAATAWDHIDTGSVPVDGDAVDANYKIDGFFPTPLWKMMNKVTQGEMGLLTGETVGTMKIMALSGVGCLALLMVLKLFGKRSLMFLK